MIIFGVKLSTIVSLIAIVLSLYSIIVSHRSLETARRNMKIAMARAQAYEAIKLADKWPDRLDKVTEPERSASQPSAESRKEE